MQRLPIAKGTAFRYNITWTLAWRSLCSTSRACSTPLVFRFSFVMLLCNSLERVFAGAHIYSSSHVKTSRAQRNGCRTRRVPSRGILCAPSGHDVDALVLHLDFRLEVCLLHIVIASLQHRHPLPFALVSRWCHVTAWRGSSLELISTIYHSHYAC